MVYEVLVVLYFLWELLLSALHGLAWGAVIGIAGTVIWWAITRED